MASSTFIQNMASTHTARRENFIQGIGFDRLMMVLCSCFIGGLFIDGWAHNHGLVDKTFFTPWHALLYSAFAANACALLTVTFLNHRRGHGWFDSIPGGYELSLLGVPLFAVGGVGDLIWHTIFGFEVGILVGFVLLAIRRWKMPIGSFTLIFTLNAALMSLFRDQYLLIPVATLAGILVDLLYWWLKPSMSNVAALRLFAFIVPFVFYLGFFVSIMLYNGGISWTIHLWLGSTFMSGIIGMVLSYLLIAPLGPTTQIE